MSDCKHKRIKSWYDGEPVPLWSCADCALKFVPFTELAAAQKDAERYRWLRDCSDEQFDAMLAAGDNEKSVAEFDATIDAAMAQEKRDE